MSEEHRPRTNEQPPVEDLVSLLAEQDARERVFESFPDPILLTDAGGVIRDANLAALALFGLPAESVFGRPVDEFMIEQPGSGERAPRLTRAGLWQGSVAVVGRGGGERTSCHVRSMVLTGFEEPMHLLVLNDRPGDPVADALAQAEARLSAIVDSATDAIVSIDRSQRIVVFNAAAEEMFRCPAAEAIGQPIDRFVPERLREAHRLHVREFASTGPTSRRMGEMLGTLMARRADGEEFPIEATISHVPGPDGSILTAIVRDITERDRIDVDAQRRLARDQAHQLEERERRLRSIMDAALTHLSLDDLLDELLGRLRGLLETDSATVLLMDRDVNVLHVRASNGLERSADEMPDVPFGMGVAGRIASEGRPVVIGDLRRAPAVSTFLRRRLRSLAGVPIVHEGRLGGVLHVGTIAPRRFDQEDIAMLEIVAARLAPVIENAFLHEAERQARAAAEADANRLRITQSLTEALSRVLPIDEVAGQIVQHIVPALGAVAGAVGLLDDAGRTIRLLSSIGYPPEIVGPYLEVPIDANLPMAAAARDGSPVFLSSVGERDGAYPALAGSRAVGESFAALPLLVGGSPRGVLTLSFGVPRTFEGSERRLMESLAHQSALALDRSSVYERERRSLRETEAAGRRLALLQSLTASLARAPDGSEIARIVVTRATAAIGATSGVVLILDEGEQVLELRAAQGYPEEALAGWERFPVDSPTPAGETLRSGRIVHVQGPQDMIERYPLLAASITDRPMGPTVTVPILAGERPVGVIAFTFPQGHQVQDADESLLSALGRHAGQALERAQLYEQERAARHEAERSRSQTERLQAVTEALTEADSAGAVIDILLDQSLVALGAVGAIIVRLTDQRDLQLVASRGYPQEVTASLRRFGVDEEGALAQAARLRTGVWLSSAAEEVGALPLAAEAVRPPGHTGAFAAVPLKVGMRLLGVLGLQFPGDRDWDEADREFVRSIVRPCAQAWAREELHEAETESRRELRRSERRYRSLVQATSTVEWVVDPAGAFVRPQEAWEAYTGQTWQEHRGLGWMNAIDPRDREEVGTLWLEARESGSVFSTEARLWHALSEDHRRCIIRAAPVRDDDGRVVEWVGTLTDVHEQRLAEQAALEREQASLVRLRVAGERLAFLAEASGVLASSLVLEETLQRLANLVVPRLADWCAVDLVEPDGEIRLVAIAHVDPAKVELARDLRRRYPTEPDAPTGVPNVVRTGRAELMPEIPAELLEEAIRARPELGELIRELQLRSVMIVPLRVGHTTFGTISFVWAESGGRYTEDDVALAEDLAHRAAVAIENARLYAAEQTARAEEEDAQRRLRILAEAGTAMAASLDHHVILTSITRLLAGSFCDWSAAFYLDRNDRVIDAIGSHRDPALDEPVQRLVGLRLAQIDHESSLVAQALRTGVPVFVPHVSEDHLARIATPGEQLELALRVGFSSAIVVPLIERGRTIGALATIRGDGEPAFDRDDSDLLVEIGRRTALALENARLYAEREYVADTLQRSLLPPSLPTVPGLEVGARYLPASEGSSVGGDFYDVFEIDLDHWAAVIGDVVGKGAEAAAMMGLARYTIRTAAMSESRPSKILEILNEAILRQTSEQRFCTACCLRILRRGNTTRVTIASGGHPLPLILRADGSLETAGKPGTLIGVFEDPELVDEVVDLRTGDALIMYTDGVTDERRGSEEFGEQRLGELLLTMVGRTAQEIADGVLQAVSTFRSDRPRDDIAVLTLRMPR